MEEMASRFAGSPRLSQTAQRRFRRRPAGHHDRDGGAAGCHDSGGHVRATPQVIGVRTTGGANFPSVERCGWATSAPEYVRYHDEEWGRPEQRRAPNRYISTLLGTSSTQ